MNAEILFSFYRNPIVDVDFGIVLTQSSGLDSNVLILMYLFPKSVLGNGLAVSIIVILSNELPMLYFCIGTFLPAS